LAAHAGVLENRIKARENELRIGIRALLEDIGNRVSLLVSHTVESV